MQRAREQLPRAEDHGVDLRLPALGRGVATLAELSDGTIYYNSRRHWAPEGENPRRRWEAISKDGGATWTELHFCEILPDGPQDTNYGLMAGLTRLPVAGRDILLFSNVDSPRGRTHGAVWASFDGGKTWPIMKPVFDGRFAYSVPGRERRNAKKNMFVACLAK